jgi:hypothetical protein
MAPPHPHAGVNFVQPSAIQQYQNFEQLNTANPTHPSNNAKKKGWNRNNNNLGQGGNQPSVSCFVLSSLEVAHWSS